MTEKKVNGLVLWAVLGAMILGVGTLILVTTSQGSQASLDTMTCDFDESDKVSFEFDNDGNAQVIRQQSTSRTSADGNEFDWDASYAFEAARAEFKEQYATDIILDEEKRMVIIMNGVEYEYTLNDDGDALTTIMIAKREMADEQEFQNMIDHFGGTTKIEIQQMFAQYEIVCE